MSSSQHHVYSPPVLDLISLTKTFSAPNGGNPVHALRNVHLAIDPGHFVSLVGPSGSGKSTLLHCAAGLEPPTTGSVHILGRDVTRLRPRARTAHRSRHVGFIFQDYNLISSLSVRENIALPARLAGRPLSDAQVRAALDRVGLRHRGDQRPAALSGGEQQRVAVARTLANRPALVFADEPTGALDVESSGRVLDWIAELPATGTTVVMVTHDPRAAARAESTVVLNDGEIYAVLHHADERTISDAVLDAQAGVPCVS